MSRTPRDWLFLLILIYILCLWLAVPHLEHDTPCREEEQPTRGTECRSKLGGTEGPSPFLRIQSHVIPLNQLQGVLLQ